MPFIKPMYASHAIPKVIQPGEWIAEQKWDGHRLIVSTAETGGNLFGDSTVRAWSRNGLERIIPYHITSAIDKLPSGIYDGELIVPGKRSYGVTELTEQDKLKFVCFDVLELLGKSTLEMPWWARREYLEEIYRQRHEVVDIGFSLTEVMRLENVEQIGEYAHQVWANDGEGLILKKTDSLYLPGKRPKSWVKVKDLRSAILTIVGYKSGLMGPHSVIVLRDDSGFVTSVKWKNYEILDDIEANHEKYLGRRVRIEYQERTPDGSYRHPRWDRWAEENE
jgi:ATP-dependent DNA ligase